MDVELFAQQIKQQQRNVHDLLQQHAAAPVEVRAIVDAAFNTLSSTLEELREQQQQHSQAALDRERRRYQALFTFAPDSYLVTDEYGVIEEANQAAGQLLDQPPHDLLKRPLHQFISRTHSAAFSAHLHQLRRRTSGVTDEWETCLEPSDGRLCYVWVRIAPVVDAHGRTTSLRWLLRDLTGRNQAEQQLQTSEATLRVILDSANQSIVLIAPDYSVLACNEFAVNGAQSVYGQRLHVGQSILDYVAPEHRAAFVEHFARALGGESSMVERQIAGRSASEWWEFYFNPIRLLDGETRGVTLTARNISSRKQTMLDLYESEERLRLAMEAAQMGHWDWRVPQQVVFWSPAHNRMIGLPPEQQQGSYEQFMERVHPDDRAPVAQALEQAISATLVYHAEFRVIWPDGTLRWLVGDGRVYRDELGQVSRMIGVIRDISGQRQAEQALRQVEAQLHTIVTYVPIVLWATDRNGVVTLSEGAGLRRLGLRPGQAVGRSIIELFPQQPTMQDDLRAALAGQRQQFVQQFDDAIFNVQTTPLRDARGTIFGLIGVAWDITAQSQSEQRLRLLDEASALLGASLDYETTLVQLARLLVVAAADMCLVDLLTADGTLRRLTLERRPDASDVLLPPAPPALGQDHPVWRALASGQPVLLPATDESAERTRALILPLVARARPLGALALARGEQRSFSTADQQLLQEIARRAALAVDHARLYSEAQAAIQTRDTFLSIASHELKTPLTSILGYAHVLRQSVRAAPETAARTERALTVIERQVHRLDALIDNMLDLSRIQRGTLTIERRPVDLGALVLRAVEEQQQPLSEHTLTLDAPPEPLLIDGDEGRLEQVVQNLLGNAVKYSPQGGPIRVTLVAEPAHARLSVRDQGIGIPAAALPHLFEPFFRAANVGAQSSGFGIGLFLVQTIVQLHGGAISVESSQGSGTTFEVCLPLSRA